MNKTIDELKMENNRLFNIIYFLVDKDVSKRLKDKAKKEALILINDKTKNDPSKN